MAATTPTTINNPKMLPTKWLAAITTFVGSGKSTPIPANNVANTGTTFHNSSTMTPVAIVKTPMGYTMADLTARCSFTFFSMYVERRCRIVSRIPPVSPASTMLEYNPSKTFGYCFMAADSVLPPSTADRVPVSTFWKVLFSCWLERISRHCTSGKPASIMTENCRVNTASSFGLTPPPKVGKLNSLPFSDIFVAVICWRLNTLCSSVLLLAVISPATDEPARFVPRYVKTGIISPPQQSKSLPNFPIPIHRYNPLVLGPNRRLPIAGFARGRRRRHSAVDHVLQLVR